MRVRRSEQGFTMIELVVAMVLGMIVLVMLFSGVFGMMRSSDRSGERAQAQRAATKAIDLLSSDLRAARAPERTPRNVGSPDNLRAMLLGQQANAPAVHDILKATRSELQFYADVKSGASFYGAECVTWSMTTAGLERRVDRRTGPCGPGTLSRTLVVPAISSEIDASVAQVREPFRYTLLVQQSVNNPDPRDCTIEKRPQANTQLAQDQIIDVRLDLRSIVSRDGSRGDQNLVSRVSLASRQTLDYKYAIGCAG